MNLIQTFVNLLIGCAVTSVYSDVYAYCPMNNVINKVLMSWKYMYFRDGWRDFQEEGTSAFL